MARILVLLLTLLLAACTARGEVKGRSVRPLPEGAVVLRVEVLEVEFTDWSPACGNDDQVCIPSHFWYRYRARVREVVSGSYDQTEIEFANLQHAEYIPAVTRDCYVVLVPASADFSSKLGVPLVADRLLSRHMKNHRDEVEALLRWSASDELSLGGIVLGQPEASVIEALGPSGERVEGEADHLPVRLSWPGLTVRLDEQGVGSIVSTGSRYCTPSGACPGMSRAEVQHIYGARLETATMGGNPVGRVWDDGCWLGFLYDSGTVHAIEVGCVP